MSPATPFPVTLAELTGLFIESVLFGIDICTFAVCLNAIAFGRGKPRVFTDWLILAIVLLMGFISVWDISLFFKNVVNAFVYDATQPVVVFSDLAHWLNVTRGTLYGVQTLLGDFILIYRCWKVYAENWVIVVFPFTMWLGVLVCIAGASSIEAHLDQAPLTAKQLSPFGTGFISLSLSLNIITTAMIAYKIWGTYSQWHKAGSSTSISTSSSAYELRRVMLTIVESGAIYSSVLVILLGVYVSGSEANVPMSDAMVQIIPIVFNTILIRVHSHRRRGTIFGNTTGSGGGGTTAITSNPTSTMRSIFFAPRSTKGNVDETVTGNGRESAMEYDMSEFQQAGTIALDDKAQPV